MATYAELYDLSNDRTLVQRITVAVAIAAEEIRTEADTVADHAARVDWAKRALVNPDGMARQVLMIALAQNSTATAAQIVGATDATLQAACNAAIALLM